MKTLEFHNEIDRTGWPNKGSWDSEPDRKQWQDKETGLPCLAVRTDLGHWCGYVGVNSKHPLFKVDESDEKCSVSVHGGLTYSGNCFDRICHVVEENEDDNIWWFGFDCAHYMDMIPSFFKFSRSLLLNTVYRDLAYVEQECTELAEQLNNFK